MRASARSNSILSTFGLLFLLQGVALVFWGGTAQEYSYLSDSFDILGTQLQYNRLIVIVASLFLSAAFRLPALHGGRPRHARHRCQPSTAPLVGIDVARYSALAFATGGALAAVAGILLSTFMGVSPTMGAAYTLDALIVVVMGGIGNVAGGLVAALILGMAHRAGRQHGQSGLGTIITFAIFSIVLLWRPQGLFGGGARLPRRSAVRLPKEAVVVAALLVLLFVPRFADIYWLLCPSSSSTTWRWRPPGRSSLARRATSRWRPRRSTGSAPTSSPFSRTARMLSPIRSRCWPPWRSRSCSRPSSASPPCACPACTS